MANIANMCVYFLLQQENQNFFVAPDFSAIDTVRAQVKSAATCVTVPATQPPRMYHL